MRPPVGRLSVAVAGSDFSRAAQPAAKPASARGRVVVIQVAAFMLELRVDRLHSRRTLPAFGTQRRPVLTPGSRGPRELCRFAGRWFGPTLAGPGWDVPRRSLSGVQLPLVARQSRPAPWGPRPPPFRASSWPCGERDPCRDRRPPTCRLRAGPADDASCRRQSTTATSIRLSTAASWPKTFLAGAFGPLCRPSSSRCCALGGPSRHQSGLVAGVGGLVRAPGRSRVLAGPTLPSVALLAGARLK
jgi:hypothetical protein